MPQEAAARATRSPNRQRSPDWQFDQYRAGAAVRTVYVRPDHPNQAWQHATEAELATNWQQNWQYQPNAATMHVAHGGIVTLLKPMALSVAPTCFQYHEYGRRTGLKIRSSQEGVGSIPTFGL